MWMANAFLITCLYHNLNFHQLWWTALEELSWGKWNPPRPKCHGCCHSPTAPRCAGDGRTLSTSTLLPFSCCVAAQRLNLMTFLIAVERPGDRSCPFSDRNNTRAPLPSPLSRKRCLYPCQQTAALQGTMCFFMAEPASLKAKHLYWPTSHLSPLPLSSPTVCLFETI